MCHSTNPVVSTSPRNPELFLSTNIDEAFDEDNEDAEAMAVSEISDEDAQSLVELSMSRMASRLKSPQTPALEKVAAMEDQGGSGFFDSDEETPPAVTDANNLYERPLNFTSSTTEAYEAIERGPPPRRPAEGMSLGRLPSPRLEDPSIPITPVCPRLHLSSPSLGEPRSCKPTGT